MTLQEMQARMRAAAQRLDTLNRQATRSADEEGEIDRLIAEINDLGEQIDRGNNARSAVERATAAAGGEGGGGSRPNRRGGLVPRTDQAEQRQAPGRPTFDARSLGRRFVESEAFQARDGNGFTDIFRFEGLRSVRRQRHNDEFLFGGDEENPIDLRAVVASGTLPASLLLPQVLPGIYRGLEEPLAVRDAFISARTQSDSIVFMKESGFTNAAAEVAEATVTNGVGLEGGVKPESGLTFTQDSVNVTWIGHWIPISRQTLQDTPQMESYVNERLLTGLARREDNQILNGNGVGSNLLGLANETGTQLADGTYFTANPVKGLNTERENFNRIRRAMTLVRYTGDAQPTFILANPADLEEWDTSSNGAGDYYFGGPGSGAVQRSMWGLPIIETPAIAAGTAWVGDGTMAAVFDRMDGQIFTTDSHADYFIRNLFVILAEERLAFAVFRPEAFVEVILA